MTVPSRTRVNVLFLWCVTHAVSLTQIRDFMCKTNVCINHVRTDLDLLEILTRFHSYYVNSNGTNVYRTDLARRAYDKGGHACIYAELSLPPLSVDMNSGAQVSQSHVDGERSAVLRSPATAGSTQLMIEYNSIERPCFEFITADVDGSDVHVKGDCFNTQAPLHFKGQSLGVPTAVSHKFQTLAEFSTTAWRMTGQTEFELRRSFYGKSDYAHLFITNAFAPQTENVGQELVPRELFGYRSSMIKHLIVFMSVWMQVIHQMEHAVLICQSPDHREHAMQAWEKGVAYYAGSSWNSAKSIFLDGAANDIARVFGTYDDDGIAAVNNHIFKHFTRGQDLLVDFKCEDLIVEKEQIVRQMYVPVVQNLLKNAFELSKYVPSESTEYDFRKDRADGAFFAKLMQPALQRCDSKLADMVIENMVVINAAPPMTSGWAPVKRAIEASYQCLGITCEDIGGILLPARERLEGNIYVSGAEPCGAAATVSSSADSGVDEETSVDEDSSDTLVQTADRVTSHRASSMLQVLIVTIVVAHMS